MSFLIATHNNCQVNLNGHCYRGTICLMQEKFLVRGGWGCTLKAVTEKLKLFAGNKTFVWNSSSQSVVYAS